MHNDQIEVLERAQFARLIAEAHGYDGTAEALGEIIEVPANSFQNVGYAQFPGQAVRVVPSQQGYREPFQVVS